MRGKKKRKKGAGIYLMIFGELGDQAVFARWQKKNFVTCFHLFPSESCVMEIFHAFRVCVKFVVSLGMRFS